MILNCIRSVMFNDLVNFKTRVITQYMNLVQLNSRENVFYR